MIAHIRQFYRWMENWVDRPHAHLILGFLFFLEAIFFIPTDPILLFFCLKRPLNAFSYAGAATVGSVLGGLTSYALGACLWHMCGPQLLDAPWLNHIIAPATLNHVMEQFSIHGWSAILIAGFTPIPYKAATFAAGFCHMSLIPVFFGSVLARGARFYLYAIIIHVYGVHIKELALQYFTYIMGATVILLATGWWLLG